MDLTVIIPFFNGYEHIENLLQTIPEGIHIIVVDDHSDVPLQLNRINAEVIRPPTKGYFTGAVNVGIRKCKNDVLVLNQDTHFEGGAWLNYLEENRKRFALIGERTSGHHPVWTKGYVHGTFMFMRRDAINKVGLLNEIDYPLWGSTCEWQLRVCRKNLGVLMGDIPGFVHIRKGSFGSSISTILKREPKNWSTLIRTPPLVSVIVPSYNHARYIRDLVSSLIGGPTSLGPHPGQTFQSFEVIIVDDCSTDDTIKVGEEVQDEFKGIKFIHLDKNGGTSVACNVAIRNAHGKYIARIDSDDMREPDSLEYMLRAQIANQHSFIYDDVRLFNGAQRLEKVWEMQEYDFDKLLYKNQIHAGIMFPKKAWEECGGYVERMNAGRDDWAFNIALGLKGYCGVHVRKPGYLYRREGQNRTLNNTTPSWREKFLHDIQETFPDVYAGRYPMGCCGGSRTTVARPRATVAVRSKSMNEMKGVEGMTLVQYVGGNFGLQAHYGPVTGNRYVFSAEEKDSIKWVDNRDLNTPDKKGLLQREKNRKFMFVVAKSRQVAIEAKPEPVPAPVKVEAAAPSEELQEVAQSAVAVEEAPTVIEDNFTSITFFTDEDKAQLLAEGITNEAELFALENDKIADILGWKLVRVRALRKTFAK